MISSSIDALVASLKKVQYALVGVILVSLCIALFMPAYFESPLSSEIFYTLAVAVGTASLVGSIILSSMIFSRARKQTDTEKKLSLYKIAKFAQWGILTLAGIFISFIYYHVSEVVLFILVFSMGVLVSFTRADESEIRGKCAL